MIYNLSYIALFKQKYILSYKNNNVNKKIITKMKLKQFCFLCT